MIEIYATLLIETTNLLLNLYDHLSKHKSSSRELVRLYWILNNLVENGNMYVGALHTIEFEKRVPLRLIRALGDMLYNYQELGDIIISFCWKTWPIYDEDLVFKEIDTIYGMKRERLFIWLSLLQEINVEVGKEINFEFGEKKKKDGVIFTRIKPFYEPSSINYELHVEKQKLSKLLKNGSIDKSPIFKNGKIQIDIEKEINDSEDVVNNLEIAIVKLKTFIKNNYKIDDLL